MHSAEKAHNITLGNQNNRDIIECCNNARQGHYMSANKRYMHAYEKINRICKNVLSMQHQPDACASDLSDDQSCYLLLCWLFN